MAGPKKLTIAMMAAKPRPGEGDDAGPGGPLDSAQQDHLDACADLADAIKGGDPQQIADALDAALESRPG